MSSSSRDSAPTRRPPPAGDPWDAPLERAPLAFVDVEMTGLVPARDRVVELCVERVQGGAVVAELASLVRPEPLPSRVGNQHVHGLDAAALAAAPTFAELAPWLLAVLDGAVLVAHGARWDVAFLQAELARAGVSWGCPHHIDTVALARRLLVSDSYRLASLARQFDIDNTAHHRAGNDVRVVRALWQELVDALGDVAKSPRALWEASRGRLPLRKDILERAELAAADQRLAAVRYRSVAKGPQELQFVVTSVRRDLDPPLVLGYLHESRGRRELRADRILSLELVAP
jgi:DNA polymerase-3 subunit epsilon